MGTFRYFYMASPTPCCCSALLAPRLPGVTVIFGDLPSTRPAGGSVIDSARRPTLDPLVCGSLFFSATGLQPPGLLIACHCCSYRLSVLAPQLCGSLLSFAHVRHLITDRTAWHLPQLQFWFVLVKGGQ